MAEQLAEGTVTILFTDIEGSTDLGRVTGDRSARQVISRHDELIRTQIAAHGGREVKALGDGFMIAFSSARRAITCAVAIQKEMKEAARSDPGLDLPVRMGLNSGEVILDGDDVFGSAVSAAARISAHARARQILVSEVVKTLVGSLPDIDFRDAGTKELKGFDEPWHLYEVRWNGDVSTARHRTPFVGREQERSELTGHLDSLPGGSGALVLIGGEPGVGKTRLAEEIAMQGTRRGFRTLVGRCYDLDSPAPYLPFIELLEAAARDVDRDTFRLALGDAAGEIAKVMPQLHKLYDDIPPGLELPADQERRYLFNSIAEFLERAASVRPLVLLLDDIHWADESSLLLAQNIAPKLESLPVLIIGTYRDLELDVNRPLSRVLEDLVRRRLAHRVSLKRFSEEGVRVLLERLGGSAPPEPLVKTIFEETDGNPFFVEEVFRHLAEEGRVFDADGGWRSGLEIGEVEVPESLRLVIGRRLERLSEGARKALTAAAVIGRTFDYRLLETVAGLGDDELLDAVEEAQQLSLIEPLSTSSLETRYEIVHELIRQTLLTGVSAPRRQRLHLKAAEGIEQLAGDNIAERAAEILNHLYRSGAAPDKTLKYLLLAGERAQESAAWEDAQRFFEEALAAVGSDDAGARARALVGLGYAKRSGGSLSEAMAHWDEALTIFEQRDDHQALGELASEMALQFGWLGRWADVVGTAARVLHLLGDERTPQRGRLLALAGVGMSWADQYDAALPLYEEAFDITTELGDKELLGQCYGVRGTHEYAYGMMASSVATGLEAMALLEGTGSQMNYVSALAFVTFAMAALGRVEEVEAHVSELHEQSDKLGFAGGLMFAHRSRMITDQSINTNPVEYEKAALADLELCERYDQPWRGQSHIFIALARFVRGDTQDALAHAQIGMKEDLPGALYGFGLGTNIYLHAYAGRNDEVLELWRTAQHHLPVAGIPNSVGRWALLAFAIEALFTIERYDDVAGLRDLFAELRFRSDQIYRFDGRILDSLHGLAAGCAGAWEDAERSFAAALERADDHPQFFEDAEVRRLFAAALLLKGDPADLPRLKEMLELALERHESRDMTFHASLVRDLLARAG